MSKTKKLQFRIRNVTIGDVKEVYNLLIANKPYVGLNSRYTYFLLAKDFSDTCVVAEHKSKIVAFSSGYISPSKKDTFFSWEAVVHKKYRGNNLQKHMLIWQLRITGAKYFEGTINPSNEASKRSFRSLAKLLGAKCEESLLFSEEDFENDGHESEILYRVGPILQDELENNFGFLEVSSEIIERAMLKQLEKNKDSWETREHTDEPILAKVA